MSARLLILLLATVSVGGCAWHYPMPVYPPFPPDHGYSAPYDPNQQYAAPVDDAALLQGQPAAPPLSGS
jgi:hypothetical protein